MIQPRLILLCGLPGAGKTTLARRLEAALPVVRLCPDEWLTALALDLWDEPLRARLETQLSRLALRLLALGQSVVLEYGFWGRDERDLKRAEARALGAAVDLYYLDPPFEELWRRLDARNQGAARGVASGTVPISRAELERYAALIQPPDEVEFALFDHAARVTDAQMVPLPAAQERQ
jgi:predicted kinase